MSHLKEPIVLNFTANTLANGAFEMEYPSVMYFKFNENLVGSYGWIPVANRPSSTVTYTLKEITTNNTFGSIQIDSAGNFIYNTTNSEPFVVLPGYIITVYSTSMEASGIKAFGVSLVGER